MTTPELQSWICIRCKLPQHPLERRYGLYYCHKCATTLLSQSYVENFVLPMLPKVVREES